MRNLCALRFSALLLPLILSLGGCLAATLTTAHEFVSHKLFMREDINLTEKSAAAADLLISQARTYITRQNLITAMPLTDRQHPGMVSDLGKIIPEQMGARLSQLGYRVDIAPVATNPDIGYLKPAQVRGEEPDFILSGAYSRRHTQMDISVRITEAATQRVLAVFDYSIPQDRDTDRLSRPKPQIIRMPQE